MINIDHVRRPRDGEYWRVTWYDSPVSDNKNVLIIWNLAWRTGSELVGFGDDEGHVKWVRREVYYQVHDQHWSILKDLFYPIVHLDSVYLESRADAEKFKDMLSKEIMWRLLKKPIDQNT